MGRVFTPEQVRLEEYPLTGAHLEASKILLQGVVEMGLVRNDNVSDDLGQVALRGVMIYGSVAYGSSKTRSDLDVFGQYNNGAVSSLKFINLLTEVETTYNVGIEPNIWPYGSINDRAGVGRRSTLDSAMLCHLKEQDFKKWGVGENPLNDYSWEELKPSKQDLFEYLGVKVDSFSKALHSPDIKQKDIQRALESPRALARKFFQILEAEGLESTAPNAADTPAVESKFEEYFMHKDQKILTIAKALMTIDGNYTELLDEAIDSKGANLASYKVFYDGLIDNAKKHGGVISLAYELTLRLREYSEELFASDSSLSDDLLFRTHVVR